eukprot:16434329-Heterocapsa_arctica.AAC.1
MTHFSLLLVPRFSPSRKALRRASRDGLRRITPRCEDGTHLAGKERGRERTLAGESQGGIETNAMVQRVPARPPGLFPRVKEEKGGLQPAPPTGCVPPAGKELGGQ